MTNHRELLLHMFNIKSLVDQRLTEDLDRLEQLDRLADWYEGFNPLPNLFELAEYQVQQRVEAAALQHFTDGEFEAFRFHWRQLSTEEQRSFLCELAGLPDPYRDRDFAD
jgi:hypothetical protein